MAKASDARKAEVVAAVFAGMADGKTVADTARAMKESPGAVRRWITERPEWFAEYQRVRPMLGASFAEEAVRVARDTRNENVPIDRLLIETLKWAAAKNAPAEYGEKQTVEHQGEQTLKVRVVEEDAPMPDQRVKAGAVATALMNGAAKALPRAQKPA